MSIIFRTAGPWGAGTGANLPAHTIDLNFWELLSRIVFLEDNPDRAVSIDYFSVSGNLLTIFLTDHSTRGPFELPVARWNFRGPWAAATDYVVQDVVTANGSAYLVTWPHHSAATFDPGANDGMGHDFYGLLLTDPGDALPLGGGAGQVLSKRSGADLDTQWADPAVAGDGIAVAGNAVSQAWPVRTRGASYTLVRSDAFSVVRMNVAVANTLTVPPNASVAFPIGTALEIGQTDVGRTTIVAGAGVTINAPDGLVFDLRFRYGRLRKTAADTWSFVFFGLSPGVGLARLGNTLELDFASLTQDHAPDSGSTFVAVLEEGSTAADDVYRKVRLADLPSSGGGGGVTSSWRAPVIVATTGNVALSGEQTIDGVLTAASRVLVWLQDTDSENGLYVSAAGAWSRATDMSTWAQVPAAAVFVEEGDTYATKAFFCTSLEGGTLGVDAIFFSQFGDTSASLQASSNLADLSNTTAARSNLGLGDTSTLNAGVGLTSAGGDLNVLIDDRASHAVNYTLALADRGKVVAGAGVTITVPDTASVGFAGGDFVFIYQSGASALTLAPGGATLIRTPDGQAVSGNIVFDKQHRMGLLRKKDVQEFPDVWHFEFLGGGPQSTTAQFLANSQNAGYLLAADIYWAALVPATLTDAATVAVDMSTFVNAKVTLAGNRTLGNPTSTKQGQRGSIKIVQDGTGSRTLGYGANWKFAGGTAPTLTTTANATDLLYYEVLDSTHIFAELKKDVK